MPRFSVIVPCLDAADTLSDTIASLTAQSFGDWECLLVDGGSRDGTAQIIARAAAADPRFHALAAPAGGPGAARNLAVGEARGEIIAFCDAGDQWLPGKLAALDTAFADPATDAAYGRVAFFDGQETRAVSVLPRGPLDIAALMGANPVCTLSNVALRAGIFRDSGGFDESLSHGEGLEWLVRLAGSRTRFTAIPWTLVMQRIGEPRRSRDIAALCRGRAAACAAAARD
ncbi:glycosyltransferase family 2 protein, partial [Mangrovicoccus algicola]